MSMKIMVALICVASCAVDDVDTGEKQQDERIDVHGCRPGYHEIDIGADWACAGDPSPVHGGDQDPPRGGERMPGGGGPSGGGGPGGGNAPVGRPVMGQPGVTIYQFDLGEWVCKSVCATMSYAICRGVELACAVGSTFTLGGLVLPCVGIIPSACLAGIFGGVACSQLLCE